MILLRFERFAGVDAAGAIAIAASDAVGTHPGERHAVKQLFCGGTFGAAGSR
jgi:hypothetical protein